jgi:YVTN family beta-propeller protein
MRQRFGAVVIGCILLIQFLPLQAASAISDYVSPLEVIADDQGQVLYISEATARQIAVFDVVRGEVLKRIVLTAPVGGMVLSQDNRMLYATGSLPKGRVYAIDTQSGTVTADIAVGHTPRELVLSPDGKKLYVCNQFNNSLSVIDLATCRETGRISVSREPVALALDAKGKTLLVVNHLPDGVADGHYAAVEISVVDTETDAMVAAIAFPNGSMSARDIALSPDGRYAYVTHILARYQLPTTQLERGWINTNALTVIDVAARKHVNTVLLDDVDLGAANPWAVACTADGNYLCVTTSGTHELSVIDRPGLHAKLTRIANNEIVSDVSLSAADVPNDLSFLVDLKRRLKLTGNGPRGLALIGTRAYIAEYFSDSLGVVDVNPEVRAKARSIALLAPAPMTLARLGERLFNDAGICFQSWQSCASCHPGDARVDALNWDLLNDGLGNPKNTKSLLYSHQTPPSMSLGVRSTAEAAVRAGIRHIQFVVRPEEDAVAIDTYLKSLEPVPSPHLVNGKLSDRARRGQEIFASAGCIRCHHTEYYTDLEQYDVGTGKLREEGKAFDTPTLIEVWRTAPYLHDGRAKTMVDVLRKYNPGDKHGRTSSLTDEQINDLAEYLLSL